MTCRNYIPGPKPKRKRSSKFVAVREREMLCGEHGTACYIEAERRERIGKKRKP